MRKCSKTKQQAFTLIELMVVVAIVGILSSLSVTLYQRSQRKSRQSEAKLALGAIYGLEKSFYSEYAAYNPAFDAIGYAPEGFRRFYQVVGCWGCDSGATWTGTVTGYAGSSAIQYYAPINNPYTGSCCAAFTCSNTPGAGSAGFLGNDPQIILPYAFGALYQNTLGDDLWSINLRFYKTALMGFSSYKQNINLRRCRVPFQNS